MKFWTEDDRAHRYALNGRAIFRCGLLIGLLVPLLLPSASLADIAATGSFSTTDIPLLGGEFSGSAIADNTSYDVLGLETVNLGALGGPAPYAFSSSWNSSTCTFTDNSTDPRLSYISFGRCTCISNCNASFPATNVRGTFVSTSFTELSGTTVDNGPGTFPLASNIHYSYNGTVRCDHFLVLGEPVQNCNGSFAINVFESMPTSTGVNVSASSTGVYFNTVTEQATTFAVDITFDSVDLAGDTLISALSGSPAIIIPEQFDTFVDSYSATFIDVVTTASLSGNIETCTTYPDLDQDGIVDGTTIAESQVRLLHDEGGTFVDRTSSIDAVLNEVCASTTSLSFFVTALAETPVVPALSPFGLVAFGTLLLGALYVTIRRSRRFTQA